MAELDSKFFVYVKSDKTDGFKEAHVTHDDKTVDATDAYYSKVTFLEGTGEIATRGKLFGTQNADVEVDGNHNSFKSGSTEYTLTMQDGKLALMPYTALSISSVSLYNGTTSVSGGTVEYDTEVTKTVDKVRYTVTGTNNVAKLGVSVIANGSTKWEAGTSTSALAEVDYVNGKTYDFALTDAVEITDSTGSKTITVNVYARDGKQTTYVSKSASVTISHSKAYIVSHTQPTAANFKTISGRTIATKPTSITFTADANNYGWFAFPTSWGTPSFVDKATGLGMTMKEYDAVEGDYNFADPYSTSTDDYKVYRTGNLCYESQVVNITW